MQITHGEWDRQISLFLLGEVVLSPSENPLPLTIESAGEKQGPPHKFGFVSSLNCLDIYLSVCVGGGRQASLIFTLQKGIQKYPEQEHRRATSCSPLPKQGWQLCSLSHCAITVLCPGGGALFPLPYNMHLISSNVLAVFYDSFHKRTPPNSKHLCTFFSKQNEYILNK